jgi:uncharacterized protein
MRSTTLTILLLFGAASISAAQCQQPPRNQITVLGSVELKEVANQVSFTFDIKGVGPSLKDAVQDANQKTRLIADKLITLGIPVQNISTSHFYSGENHGDKAFLSSSRDFQATLTTLVKVDSVPLLDAVLYTISESGPHSLSQLIFSLKDELAPRRRAREAAALKAKEKAEDMTRALGVKLGKLISLEETDPTRVLVRGNRADYINPFNLITPNETESIDESRGSAFFAQTIFFTSQVKSVFEISSAQ